MLKFKELVPAESSKEFGVIVEEGKMVAWMSLQASLGAVDSASRTLSSGITMIAKVQQTMQDLHFDGAGLFAEQTDS